MKPHRFVQARRPRAARDVPKGKSARSSVFPVDENTSAPITASYGDLITKAEFAMNSIASGAYFISTRGQFGIKVQTMREPSRSATA